jgi:SAM-dependent methyltransferase
MDFWAMGDYGKVADLIGGMGIVLVEAAEVKPGMRVLDVGAGTGNATLPAAATGADVVASDLSPGLLARGQAATERAGLSVEWVLADAAALPFADGEFDVVLSCIGAMFAPDQEATAGELLRVCRPGGTIAMANWTPDGWATRLFGVLAPHLPPHDPGPAPSAWGEPDRVRTLLGPGTSKLDTEERLARLDFAGTPAELVEHYRRHFPPVLAAYAGTTDPAALDRGLLEWATGLAARPGGWGYEYLLVTGAADG